MGTTYHMPMEKASRKRGAALLIFVIFFLFTSVVLTIGVSRLAYESIAEADMLYESKRAYAAAEAGIEDAVYRHKRAQAYSGAESFVHDGIPVTVNRMLLVDTYHVTSMANASKAVRRSYVELAVGDGASFNFGMQSGNGGIAMSNSASVRGNVYSNGSVTGSGNMVYGDVISAGPSGLVKGITATGSVWAHSIESSTVGKSAYYQSIAGTLVSGGVCPNSACFPGSVDQATATMPIPDSMISDWEASIANTGTYISATSSQCAGGTYTINQDTSLGNVRIGCDLATKNSINVTLTGPVWIEGTFTISNSTNLIASSSLGAKSVMVIADHSQNDATSSAITIGNSATFTSGNGSSYIGLIAMNTSALNGGTFPAIDMTNSASGKLLLYAPYGLIAMGNSAELKEVTGYQIKVMNTAQVIYESGLASLLFTSGPGGGYTLSNWSER